jgi:diadenosine tetraphosphate (Ap4A) HIT family hydrolase
MPIFRDRKEWDEIQPVDKGISLCTFCDLENNNERILRKNEYRYIIHNLYPCGWPERGEKHLLLIPKKHLQFTHDLDSDQRWAKKDAEQWIHTYFSDQSYFSFIKHTDDIKSLQHIHYHYIVWNLYHSFLELSIRYWDENNLSS